MKVRIHGPEPLERSNPWRFAQLMFLIIGLLAIGLAAYNYAARNVYQAYENREFDRALSARAPVQGSDQRAAPPPVHAPAQQHQPVLSPRELIGRIAIPRLGISAIIREGVNNRTLGLAVGHIPSTALPGEPGNVGLAAHRDNLFRSLKDVARDDEITLTTLDNTYIYRVASFRVVNPEEVSVLAPKAGEKTLTLITCYPFYFVGHAPKRFVVRAVQVTGATAASGAPKELNVVQALDASTSRP
jgi:sortase A